MKGSFCNAMTKLEKWVQSLRGLRTVAVVLGLEREAGVEWGLVAK